MRLLLFSILLFANFSYASTFGQLEYNIYYQVKNSQTCLKVELTMDGQFDQQLLVTLPSNWGASNYWQNLQNLQVTFPANTLNKVEDDMLIISLPPQTQKVQLSYDIITNSLDTSNVMDVIVSGDIIQAPGHGLFAMPNEVFDGQQLNFLLNWQNFPQDWNIVTSYGVGRNLSFSQTAEKMLHAAYASGKMRVYQIYDPQIPIYFSIHGDFNLGDKQMIALLDQIIISQRSFFQDNNFPFSTINILQSSNPERWDGTLLSNSFMASVPQDIARDEYYLLLAHENLHNWIGGKLRNNQDEELNYWWSEGFTEYYSRVIALRSGGISMDKFIEELNNFFSDYYLSPVLNEPNTRIQQDFWKNVDIEKLPYKRGLLFAIYLNYYIKSLNPANSLDNVMFDLLSFAERESFSMSLFKKVINNYIPGGIDKQLEQFIGNGQTIWLDQLTQVLPLELVEIGQYYLGFDLEELKQNNVIKNLDPDSNAYKAGLREGDKISSWYFPRGYGDADQEVVLGTWLRSYKFRPEGPNKRNSYRFAKNLSQEDLYRIKQFFYAN